MRTPSGNDRDLGSVQGWKRGGSTVTGHGGRLRHAAWGVETSGGSRQVAGVGDIQVDGAPQREGRWVAGVTERCGNEERILMGGSSDGGRTNKDTETAETGRSNGASISIKN